MVVTPRVLTNRLQHRLGIAAVTHLSKRLPALAVAEAKSCTVTLSRTPADARRVKVLPKAKSLMVVLQLLR